MVYYCAAARSNYFRVKDKELFLKEFPTKDVYAWFEKRDNTAHQEEYCCLCFGEDSIPFYDYDEEEDKQYPIDWAAFFKRHLCEDSVVFFLECGLEELRYLTGVAIAYNAKGEELQINLNDIYSLVANEWGGEVTKAEYAQQYREDLD